MERLTFVKKMKLNEAVLAQLRARLLDRESPVIAIPQESSIACVIPQTNLCWDKKVEKGGMKFVLTLFTVVFIEPSYAMNA